MQNQYVLRDVASPHFKAPAQDTSDEALIDLIADGDKRAMQVLYARHNVRVYRFILRLTGNQSLAEDLVSEVFLDVWRQAEAFESKSQVSTWLLAIAALAMLLFLLVLGAFVILIPLAGLLLAVIIAVGLFRVLIWRRP